MAFPSACNVHNVHGDGPHSVGKRLVSPSPPGRDTLLSTVACKGRSCGYVFAIAKAAAGQCGFVSIVLLYMQ